MNVFLQNSKCENLNYSANICKHELAHCYLDKVGCRVDQFSGTGELSSVFEDKIQNSIMLLNISNFLKEKQKFFSFFMK